MTAAARSDVSLLLDVPDRIIRDRARRSPTLQRQSDASERAWWRLEVACDDYGRFDADPAVLLADLFPRRPRGWTVAKMRAVLDEWTRPGPDGDPPLVVLYRIKERTYGYLPAWPEYQRPPRLASKYPDPPGAATVPAEQTIHHALFSYLQKIRRFCGYAILQVDRNVRAGNGFADLVLLTDQGRLVVEIKRTRADQGVIRQVSNYMGQLRDVRAGVIVATGIGPTADAEAFRQARLALITYDEAGRYTLTVPSAAITTCDLPVISHEPDVILRESTRLPGTRDEGREARDEGREARAEIARERCTTAQRILEFLNEKAGKTFPANDTNLGLILARLREGATDQDCRAVIARKVRQWKGDPKMHEFLRPATLFNRTKFASYTGEAAPESTA